MIKKIVFIGLAFLIVVGVLSYRTPASQLPAKPALTEFELDNLRANADLAKEQLLKKSNLNNSIFVSVTRPAGSIWKFNERGEVLDPWGLPYSIVRQGNEIIISSPGLENHNKMPWFERLSDR
jgi:hypothetical protein